MPKCLNIYMLESIYGADWDAVKTCVELNNDEANSF